LAFGMVVVEPNAIALLAGILFLVIAVVGGGFTIERLQVPTVPNWSRIASAVLGVLFVGGFFYTSMSNPDPVNTQTADPNSTQDTQAPQTPAPATSTAPGVAVLHDFSGSVVTADGVELTQFRVSGPDPEPSVGDTLTVDFSIQNAGQDSILLDFTFVGARAPGDENNDFGEANQDKTLAPGESLTMQHSVVVDQAGSWSIWPCYEVLGHDCPAEWNSFPVNVAG
jgi:hypothetical protein